jgi:hypothetical protein
MIYIKVYIKEKTYIKKNTHNIKAAAASAADPGKHLQGSPQYHPKR